MKQYRTSSSGTSHRLQKNTTTAKNRTTQNFNFTAKSQSRFNEIQQGNADDPAESASLSQKGLDIVKVLEKSDNNEYNGQRQILFDNKDMEKHDIPTIDLTTEVMIDYAENHAPNDYYTCSKSTS